MDRLNKILSSLKESVSYLKSANDSIHENDKQQAFRKLTLAKLNVEFATAYCKLLYDIDDLDEKWKPKVKTRKLKSNEEILNVLSDAISLINKALNDIERNPHEAYKSLWLSRLKVDSALLSTKRG